MSKHLRALLAMLIVLSMVLAACGGGNEEAEPTAAPVVEEATAAPVATAVPTEAVAATEAMTETETMSETEAMTATDSMTETETMTATETTSDTAASSDAIVAEFGHELSTILLPKFLGILVFDQANNGAQEAAAELGAPAPEFTGPTAENSVQGQIETVTAAATQGVGAIMISNNAGDQLAPVAQAAKEAGLTVVTWDSPIPSAEGEDLFVAQVDFDETGKVMADMAMNILGEEGGQFAVLSASPDAANQNAWIASLKKVLETDSTYANLELVDVVYGNDQSEDSYDQALALVDKYPDMGLIMAPTTVGIAAAAKAMQDEDLCDTVKVSGLGLPAEMVSYTLNGCAPEFALWSFTDLGYLTYYSTYLLADGQMEAAEGVSFEAGRMGTYTIEKDPTRDAGLRVVMGPFTVYNADNVEAAAQ